MLNMAKESAARVLAAERRAAALAGGVAAAKDDGVATLVRLKAIMEARVRPLPLFESLASVHLPLFWIGWMVWVGACFRSSRVVLSGMRERGTGIWSSGAPEFAAILGRFWGAFVLAPFGILVSGFGERLFRCHSEL
jgi:hypothetical protein